MIREIFNAYGEKLDTAFHPATGPASVIVVIGHGVTGHKDRPFLVALAEELARSGIPALRLSFSGNGSSGGYFADSCVTKEVSDLRAVIDFLTDYEVTYVGHSMGAAVGVQCAAQNPRIRRLVSIAGMVNLRAFAERHFAQLEPGRDLMFGKVGFPLSRTLIDDLHRIDSVIPNARRVEVPWLFVHGSADTLVPIQDAYDAFAAARAKKKLVTLVGCDHVWEPGFTPQMTAAVLNFLTREDGGGNGA